MAEMMVRTLSSRRETTSENQQQVAKKIGCMSGIFHLLHNHHPLLHRKRLTSSCPYTSSPLSLSLTIYI